MNTSRVMLTSCYLPTHQYLMGQTERASAILSTLELQQKSEVSSVGVDEKVVGLGECGDKEVE